MRGAVFDGLAQRMHPLPGGCARRSAQRLCLQMQQAHRPAQESNPLGLLVSRREAQRAPGRVSPEPLGFQVDPEEVGRCWSKSVLVPNRTSIRASGPSSRESSR